MSRKGWKYKRYAKTESKCEMCGNTFKCRARAKTCSQRCRKALSRATGHVERKWAVTDSGSNNCDNTVASGDDGRVFVAVTI